MDLIIKICMLFANKENYLHNFSLLLVWPIWTYFYCFIFIYIFMCLFVWCISVHYTLYNAHRVQIRTSNLQVVSHSVSAGYWIRILWKSNILNCWDISSAHKPHLFLLAPILLSLLYHNTSSLAPEGGCSNTPTSFT